jgi:hypothetical protein
MKKSLFVACLLLAGCGTTPHVIEPTPPSVDTQVEIPKESPVTLRNNELISFFNKMFDSSNRCVTELTIRVPNGDCDIYSSVYKPRLNTKLGELLEAKDSFDPDSFNSLLKLLKRLEVNDAKITRML